MSASFDRWRAYRASQGTTPDRGIDPAKSLKSLFGFKNSAVKTNGRLIILMITNRPSATRAPNMFFTVICWPHLTAGGHIGQVKEQPLTEE